jgi:hypothetical protein
VTAPWTRRAALGVVTLLLAGACGSQPVILPSRNFDRPTDIALTCLKVFADDTAPGGLRVGGRPMSECHPPGIQDPKPGVARAGTEGVFTFAFLPNSERGDLSAVDMSFCRKGDTRCFPQGATIVDLDLGNIGFGGAPLGVLPEVLVSSQDGCRLLSANRGSCDLSLVDPSALMSVYLLPPELREGLPPPTLITQTIVPRTPSGRLALAPGEVVFLPQQTAALRLPALPDGSAPKTPVYRPMCDVGGRTGTAAAPVGAPAASVEAPTTWRALVTFPSCDLVALMDFPSGDVLDSVQVIDGGGAAGLTLMKRGADPSPFCPRVDCGADPSGAAAAQSKRVGPLVIRPEGTRAYVGAANAPAVWALDIAGGSSLEPASVGARTDLETAGGIVRMRLSVDPFAAITDGGAAGPELGGFVRRPERDGVMATDPEPAPQPPLEFLYVIARDGSVRVVDVGRRDAAGALAAPVECDLSIDPLDPRSHATDDVPAGQPRPARIGCFPVYPADMKPDTEPRRRWFAGGPGLRPPTPAVDVAFATYLSTLNTDPAIEERVVQGAFAYILTVSGQVLLANIDPRPRQILQVVNGEAGRHDEWPVPLTHSLRNRNVISFSAGLAPDSGPPRLGADPARSSGGPELYSFPTRDSRQNSRVLPETNKEGVLVAPAPERSISTFAYFPDPTAVNLQTWNVVWEGDLAGPRIGGDLPPAGEVLSPYNLLLDSARPFCSMGAMKGDVLTLGGCEEDNQCGAGQVCVRSMRAPEQVGAFPIPGLCLHWENANELRDGKCAELLETFRRYEIVEARSEQLKVRPKLDQLPWPPQCNVREDCVGTPDMSSRRKPDDPRVARFDCLEVDAPGSPKRCVQKCGDPGDDPCRVGAACVDFPPAGKRCALAVPIPDPEVLPGRGVLTCFPELITYTISAGNAFVVSGTAVGRIEPMTETEITNPDGTKTRQCALDTSRLGKYPEMVSRIPMSAPDCDRVIPETMERVFDVDQAMVEAEASNQGEPIETTLSNAFFKPGLLQVRSGNPCIVRHRPRGATNQDDRQPAALFRNTELRFLLTGLDSLFAEGARIRFEVHGGFATQQVFPSLDVGLGLPGRMVTGPISSFEQTMPGELVGNGSDMPYLLVVDQREFLGGRLGPRGQIVRIHPRFQAVAPSFESFRDSNQYFPVK